MANLQQQINALASEFAASIVKAFAGASFADIAALTTAPSSGASPRAGAAPKRKRTRPARKAAQKTATPAPAAAATTAPANKNASGGKGGKAPKKPLMRRGPAEIAKILARIVEVVAKKAQGMRSEEIGKALGLKSNELPRPLKEGLDSKKLFKRGEKRATTYFARK